MTVTELISSDTLKVITDIFNDSKNDHIYLNVLRNASESENDEAQKNILKILSEIMSYSFSSKDVDAPFTAMIIMSSGSRTSNIEDLTDSELMILREMKSYELPPQVLSRINDILWIREKDYISAQDAINYYLALADLYFDSEKWIDCSEYIERANVIANKLGQKNGAFNLVCSYIDKKIIELAGTDSLFLSIILIELQIKNSYGNFNKYLGFIQSIIENSKVSPINEYRIDNAFKCKELLLRKLKRETEIKESYLHLAQYYECEAEKMSEIESIHPFQPIHLFEKALFIYRQHSFREDVDRVQRKLEPIKMKINEHMQTIKSPPIDISDIIDDFKASIDKCSFQEAIINLVNRVSITTKQEAKDDVISLSAKSIFMNMFGTNILDKWGRTVATLPPLSNNPESNPVLLEKHMHHRTLSHQNFYGSILHRFICLINEKYEFQEKDLDFIFNDNCIIPNERTAIMRLGMFNGLKRNYYVALHLLVPQMENLFRELAHLCGDVISTFEEDRTEQTKVLTSVFELPCLVDCYDENVLFMFKGLLNEKCGANLRNLIAHGIMDSYEGNSAVAVYFICVCLKIFSWYSKESFKMLLRENQNTSNS